MCDTFEEQPKSPLSPLRATDEGCGDVNSDIETKKLGERKKSKRVEHLEKKIKELKLKNKDLKKKNAELQQKLLEYEKLNLQRLDSQSNTDSETLLSPVERTNSNDIHENNETESTIKKQKFLMRSTSQDSVGMQKVTKSMENLTAPRSPSDRSGGMKKKTGTLNFGTIRKQSKTRNSLSMIRENGEQDAASDKIMEADLRSLSIKTQFDDIIAKLEGDENKKKRLRMKAIQELLLTEADYLRDLEVIVQIWLTPLRDNSILKPIEINSIFSNIELIFGINQLLMEDLMRKVDEHASTNFVDCNFGDVFLDIGNFLKMYIQYVSNHEKSIETYELCRKQSQFTNFIKGCETRTECRNLNLISFLVKPIQRVCKYPLLLKELLNLTPDDHPDYINLKKAIEQLETVTITINEGKRHEENQRKTMDIVKKLVGIDPGEIVIPTRRFIQEADFTKISKGKAQVRHFFLFNDLIVYAKCVSKRKETYQFKDKLSLETTICGNLPDTEKYQFAFELTRVDAKMKKYIICTDSEETKANWIQNIMKQHKEVVNLGEKLEKVKNKEASKS